jgi:hypothetical protein
MTDTITRSPGIPVTANGVFFGMAGGGYRGATAELDATVALAAEKLAAAYGQPVEIRFNSDRESGGAWLKTSDGGHNAIGIAASLTTAQARARWLASAEHYEREADTGFGQFGAGPGGALTKDQRAGARELAALDRRMLAENPEGQVTVCAHITRAATLPELRAKLARLTGWNTFAGGYHHGDAASVTAALSRCLRFAPPAADLAAMADMEYEGAMYCAGTEN